MIIIGATRIIIVFARKDVVVISIKIYIVSIATKASISSFYFPLTDDNSIE